MPSALTAGLAQGFASTFVPEFKQFMAGRRAAKGVNQAADALGAYYQDASLGQMFKTMGNAALAGGADPAEVTSRLFQQGLAIQKSKLSYQHGLGLQNNSFGNQGAILQQKGALEALDDQRAQEYLRTQGSIFDENDARAQGRQLVRDMLTQGAQNKRTQLEAGVRVQSNQIQAQKANINSPPVNAPTHTGPANGDEGTPSLNALLN